MTAKRYRKLLCALIGKIMRGTKGCGEALKCCRTATPDWEKFGTYQEAWDSIAPIRQMYGMGDIDR